MATTVPATSVRAEPGCEVEWTVGSPVMCVFGELDHATTWILAKVLDRALLTGVRPLLLDMSEVTFMDASAVRVLVHAQKVYGSSDSPVLRVVQASRAVEKLLRVVEMEHLLADEAPSRAS